MEARGPALIRPGPSPYSARPKPVKTAHEKPISFGPVGPLRAQRSPRDGPPVWPVMCLPFGT
ncbi:hypothetical protein L484_016184 [Morus notabilis]|uniref:Uncharacterized protein n=1 Tax=Morus notabilis TaxID=981085 RepID=W9RQA5_9ROSA|nr:hypothetical protein L484_016184 [Morus notabilis]